MRRAIRADASAKQRADAVDALDELMLCLGKAHALA